MKRLRFYEHFAVAYGTIWLVLMLLAVCTETHINTGIFGLIGFPILALIYAFIRRARDAGRCDGTQAIRATAGEQGAGGIPQ